MSSKNKIYVRNHKKSRCEGDLSDNEVRVWVIKDSIALFRLKAKGKVTVSTPKLLTGIIDVTVGNRLPISAAGFEKKC